MGKQKKMTPIVASIAMVAVTAMSLGTATYAWFTRGTEAAATGFNFTASAASGIQISTDAVNWQSTVTGLDFDTTTEGGAQEGNRLTLSSMEPVSTVDSLTSGEYSFFGATSADGAYTLTADTTNYLVFDLYFLNQGAEDLTLSLTSDSTVTDGVTDADTSLSTRVAFVVEGSHNTPATVIAMAGGVSSYIWEPNSLARSASALGSGAVNSAKYNYNGISTANGGTPIDTLDAYNFIAANAAYTDLVDNTNDIAVGDSPIVGSLPGATGGQITKIKVFVWIEGQDVDCNNGTSAGDVVIELGFDSGAASTTLPAKTGTVLDTVTNVTTLTVTGTDVTGTTYTAFIFRELTDSAVSLAYRLYLTTGDAIDVGSGVASIVLDAEVSSLATYQVIVIGTFTGNIGSRTDADVVIS